MSQCVENTANPVWGDAVQVDGYTPGNDLLKITTRSKDKDNVQGSKYDYPIVYVEIEVRDIHPFSKTIRSASRSGRSTGRANP